MQIIEITEVDKKRVRITLEAPVSRQDNTASFVLYKREVKTYGLEEGGELAALVYQEIRDEILVKRAKKRAMHLLEKMDRTESSLRMKLKQNYYGEDIIDEAIAYVKKYGYIDDQRYAGNYVRFQSERKSKTQIKIDLIQKGIDKEMIALAIEEEYKEGNDYKLIERWIEKKRYDKETADLKEKQKIYQFLLRKGFCHDDILYVLDHLT